MPTSNPHAATRLSQSPLWDIQTNYYQQCGISAWGPGAVPYHVTNNPTLAYQYAHLIAAFIQDYADQSTHSVQTCTLVELGGGCGKFAFLLIQALTETLQQICTIPPITLRYILGDCSDDVVAFCQSHPKLKPLIEKNILHCIPLTLDNLDHLANCGWPPTSSQPCVIIANYVFDSLPCDAFYCHNQSLFEAKVQLSPQSTARNRHDLKRDFTYHPCLLPYYSNATLNALLSDYTQTLHDKRILIPLGAIEWLSKLQASWPHPMLVLTADKGYLTPEAFDYEADFNLVRDGSVATMVNFHALSAFFRKNKGDSHYPKHAKPGIQLCPLLLNGTFTHYPQTTQAIDHQFTQTTPNEIIHMLSLRQHTRLSYRELTELIETSHYDPQACSSLNPQFLAIAPSLNMNEKQELGRQLTRAIDHLYFMPVEGDDVVLLAQVFRFLDLHTLALSLLNEYLTIYGETFWLCFETALNYTALNQPTKARPFFIKAHKKNPHHVQCKQYLDNCYI